MKKLTALLLAALFCTTAAEAQDLIVKRDAARIEARIVEISPEAIRYKRVSNPDGPTYVLPVAEVDHIRYANGETDRFTVPANGVEYVLKEYKIGEYYDRNGIQGVICALTEDRQHGLVVSVDETTVSWSEFRKPDLCVAGADNPSDGEANMEAVARYIDEHGASWEDFPAFKWCREKGDGWYLPAIDELLAIGTNYNGGSRMKSDRDLRLKYNDTLKEHEGKKFSLKAFYYSSTEKDDRDAYTSHMNVEPPYVIPISKYTKFYVRAVHKF